MNWLSSVFSKEDDYLNKECFKNADLEIGWKMYEG